MKLLVTYISQRFKPLQFLVLACLLSLLIYHPTDEIAHWLNCIGFLFASFFAFRFLDDVFSVYIDRIEHPEREYLNSKNYTTFIVLSACVLPIYLTTLFYFEWPWPFIASIILLIILSVILYVIFSKNESVMRLIPLLKYPVLLGAFIDFPDSFLPQIIASFFIVLAYDLAEDIHHSKGTFWVLLAVELICGLLLFHHLTLTLFLLFLIAPIIQTVLAHFFSPAKAHAVGKKLQLSGYRYLHIQLIFYYPITYFVFTYFSTL